MQLQGGFSDGFPFLVTTTSSLAGLNRRLADKGESPIPMERFRPNLVFDIHIDGALEPGSEDNWEKLLPVLEGSAASNGTALAAEGERHARRATAIEFHSAPIRVQVLVVCLVRRRGEVVVHPVSI